jgi:hypothetical protein
MRNNVQMLRKRNPASESRASAAGFWMPAEGHRLDWRPPISDVGFDVDHGVVTVVLVQYVVASTRVS